MKTEIPVCGNCIFLQIEYETCLLFDSDLEYMPEEEHNPLTDVNGYIKCNECLMMEVNMQLEEIKEIIRRKGHECLMVKNYSKNPGDWYLKIVFAKTEMGNSPYVTWCFNTEDKGLFWGRYFSSFAEALQDFKERGVKQNALENA